MAKARSTELECFVLGIIWQFGPCSAYDVRRHLAASPSTQWSGSAGAIYPLVRNLERRRLVRAKDQATGRRPKRVYAITPAGRRTVQAWLGPPLSSEAVSVAYDPLRTRARFLGLVPAPQRQAWARAAEAALAEVHRRVQEWQGAYGGDDPFLALTTRSGELDVQSRRAWLREVARAAGLQPEPHHADAHPPGPARRSVAGRGG